MSRLLDDFCSSLFKFAETFSFLVAHFRHHFRGEGLGLAQGVILSLLSDDVMGRRILRDLRR